MSRKNLLIISLCILILAILSWCSHQFLANEKNTKSNQILQNFLQNKTINKYKKIINSGFIQENLELNIKWENKNTLFTLTISSIISKNISSGAQEGKYRFIFISENNTFLEKTTISWDINIISMDGEYFIKPENIQFYWPKWKYSNQEIERKISEINNKWIKIDKEIPLTSFLETILNTQRLSYKFLKSEDKETFIHAEPAKDWSINISNISDNYKNIYSSWTIYPTSWDLYLSWIQKLIRQKNGNKFKIINFLKKWDLISDVKINRGQKKIKIYFDSSLIYNNLPKSTQELKLDIKWKYIITSNRNAEINAPEDYTNFTETYISKKKP